MKWKHEMPNKYDFMRVNTVNFIENEKLNSELEHERNVGRINREIYQNCQRKSETTTGNLDRNLSSASIQLDDKEHISRTNYEVSQSFQPSSRIKYVNKCYFRAVPVPVWYSESLRLYTNSTKRYYSEKVLVQTKLQPYRWEEEMTTAVKSTEKFVSEITIPVEKSDIHYISIQPQLITQL